MVQRKKQKPVEAAVPPPEELMTEPAATKKEEKLYQNFLKATEQYVVGKGYKPSSFEALCKKLCLHEQHIQIFQRVLEHLVTSNVLYLDGGRYYHEEHEVIPVVKGTLIVHPRGFAFLQPDKSYGLTQDIFIPKHLTMNAINADIVEVVINTQVPPSDKGPEGKVVAILERSRTHVAGIVRAINRKGAWAYVPLVGEDRSVLIDEQGLEVPLTVGDRLVMAVEDWGTASTPVRCTVSHHLGHISDPACDIVAAIEEHGLRADFPTAVIEEARTFGRVVKRNDITGREDLRDLEIFTIDPETAKDYDDALSLSVDEQGNYHLGVHIADVSHYVRPGSALDLEASLRCNSTYFPSFCLPMLPHELSSHLCSLCANVNRLTISVFVTFDASGNMLDHRITRSVIKSQKRFTYEQAKEVLDGKRRSKHAPTLRSMVDLCLILKKQRYQRGSIEFSLPELVILVDASGTPYGTKRVSYDITHQLVEEFMLKANELVALHLFHSGKGLAYRVHDQPSVDNMREFVQVCHAFGFKMPSEPTPADFQALFDKATVTPYGEYLANAYIRRMRLACYSAENIGHFGLNLGHYCHFTSPIRRYVDLVIHRSLFEEAPTSEALNALATQCSEKERLSARAEQNVLTLKKLRWLHQLKEENPYRQYEAIVTRVKNFGISFEILDVMLEGFLHISELGNDYYIYDSASMQLVGEHTGIIFQVADKITVQLNQIDFILKESRWHLVAHPVRRKKDTAKTTKRDKKPIHSADKLEQKPPNAKPSGRPSGRPSERPGERSGGRQSARSASGEPAGRRRRRGRDAKR